MKAKPKPIPTQASISRPHANQPLLPLNCWRSAAIGISAYVFEESEAAIRRSGLVPEWVSYPTKPGSGIAVPAHHAFPNYLKLLRLKNGRLRLVIDARTVLRRDTRFQRFVGSLMADSTLSLVRGESE
ncbi:MAG: hypothetical protein H0X43_09290 [Nitrosospira sp.]|nr:hypothetical protein [Nitrosospira sp.]